MTLQLPRTSIPGPIMVSEIGPLSAAGAGDLLRRRREGRGLTQDQLADLVEVDKSYISKLEGGVHNVARSKYLPKIAAALNLSEDDVRSINPGAIFDAPAPPAPQDFTVEVPAELLEAAELYKEIDPLIAHPTVQQQLSRAGFFGGGPQTPQQWIRYFNDIREWIKVEN